MARTREPGKITLKQFIDGLENRGQAILKNFTEQNTQFSTKFIIHKFLAQNEKQLKNIRSDKSAAEKPLLPAQWLAEQDWAGIQEHLENEFDPANLNFIEANQLAERLNEYLIGIYRSIILKTSSSLVKKVLAQVIAKKNSINTKLKSDYTRLSTET